MSGTIKTLKYLGKLISVKSVHNDETLETLGILLTIKESTKREKNKKAMYNLGKISKKFFNNWRFSKRT